MELRFGLDRTGRFLVKSWEDEAVAYDVLSGDTHLLDPLSLAVLVYLSDSVRPREEIVRHLASSFELPIDEHSRDYIHATLTRLETVGLLELRDD
ncbi:MAG: HPr-rel-A system PqqD family peptide chaperone [Pseudomonadota bacterium]|uniref:HPr-rel-A system PqqD family peptide chaperone n=1 Tax=Sulfuricystis thermophila TaxID=2496847 RepID=UPI0010361D90|nr:HPr-rel-A system PqqD family peptide chaperone [Sulfuricystis thermophila]MDI6749830.1 HPr-rel-A system PqqD family peptide chaperone [Rhodocyclaceae bacterium]